MSSQISTNRASPGTSVARKIRSVPNGTSSPPRRMTSPRWSSPGGEPARLVELAVGRQVRLRGDPEDLAAVDHHGAVVDPVPVAQRRADDEHRAQVARSPRPGRRWPPAPPRAGCPGGTGRRSSSRSGTARGRSRPRRRRRGTPAPRRARSRRWSPGRRWHRHRAGGDPREPVGVGGVEVHVTSVADRRTGRVRRSPNGRCGLAARRTLRSPATYASWVRVVSDGRGGSRAHGIFKGTAPSGRSTSSAIPPTRSCSQAIGRAAEPATRPASCTTCSSRPDDGDGSRRACRGARARSIDWLDAQPRPFVGCGRRVPHATP